MKKRNGFVLLLSIAMMLLVSISLASAQTLVPTLDSSFITDEFVGVVCDITTQNQVNLDFYSKCNLGVSQVVVRSSSSLIPLEFLFNYTETIGGDILVDSSIATNGTHIFFANDFNIINVFDILGNFERNITLAGGGIITQDLSYDVGGNYFYGIGGNQSSMDSFDMDGTFLNSNFTATGLISCGIETGSISSIYDGTNYWITYDDGVSGLLCQYDANGVTTGLNTSLTVSFGSDQSNAPGMELKENNLLVSEGDTFIEWSKALVRVKSHSTKRGGEAREIKFADDGQTYFFVLDNGSAKHIYELNTTDDSFTGFGFDVGTAGATSPRGFEILNGEFYVTDRTNGNVFKFATNGNFLETFAIGKNNPIGLVHDGTNFYLGTDGGGVGGIVRRFNDSFEEEFILLNTSVQQGGFNGLWINGNEIWALGFGNREFFVYDKTTGDFINKSMNFSGLNAGLGMDNTATQMYITHPKFNNGIPRPLISKYNIEEFGFNPTITVLSPTVSQDFTESPIDINYTIVIDPLTSLSQLNITINNTLNVSQGTDANNSIDIGTGTYTLTALVSTANLIASNIVSIWTVTLALPPPPPPPPTASEQASSTITGLVVGIAGAILTLVILVILIGAMLKDGLRRKG